jgi:hypothetical protein
LSVDLGCVPDIDRQRFGDQHSGYPHSGRCPYASGKLLPRQSDRGGGIWDNHCHHLLSAARAYADDRGVGYRRSGLDSLLDADWSERAVGGRDDVY